MKRKEFYVFEASFHTTSNSAKKYYFLTKKRHYYIKFNEKENARLLEMTLKKN